ncbi:MAG TPA: RES family NAD+ phosphorylase, partial [Usitatibacter sp.]|nr:RES family NAD+ phosphorylase [Usitatibacter sp.]
MSGPVRLWRIASETREYRAIDLSGGGSANKPGRWNDSGEHVVYASTNLAVCVLETAAYVNPAGLPLNRFVIAIDVSASAWASREEIDPAKIDPAWCAVPAGRASVDIGSRWYRNGRSLFLLVPSVILPEERGVLINARHPLAPSLTATVVRPFSYHHLFRPG